MLGAFLDDSGTHAGSPAVVIGGLLGSEQQWDAFEAAWAKLLAAPLPGKPPLKNFHLAPARQRRGEFENYSLGEIDAITHDFRRIIIDIEFVTIAVAVNNAAWGELVTGDLTDQLGVPADLCFNRCIELIRRRIRADKPWEKVMIVVDQGTKLYLAQWRTFYHSHTEMFPEIDRVIFAPVPKVVGLQGADMIATETYQYAKECLKIGRDAAANAHFREYLRRELSVGLLYDREHIEQGISRFRETGRTKS